MTMLKTQFADPWRVRASDDAIGDRSTNGLLSHLLHWLFSTTRMPKTNEIQLEDRPVDYNSVLGGPETPPESHVLEYILYRRNVPLIDLALAEHGRSGSVLERVFRRGNSPTRVVACANPSLFVGDVVHESIFRNTDEGTLLWHIVRHGSLAELRAVCGNPDISSGFYAALIDSWEGHEESRFAPDARISSDRFKHILFFLSKNPRVSTPREESKERYFYDGAADYQYTQFFTKCWELAMIVPVESDWAFVLAELYEELHQPYDVFDNVEEVLDRWRSAKENLDASLYPPSPFPNIREQIAAKFVEPSIEMAKSDDSAVRQAFYRTFDPERPEFREFDWTEWLERDEWCGFWLSGNDKVWRSSLGRRKLRSLLRHESRKNNDRAYIGIFDEREEEYRKTNPEWFENEEEQEECEGNDPEPDRVANLENAIRNLAATYAKRRSIDAIWFLVAALVGSLIGAAIS